MIVYFIRHGESMSNKDLVLASDDDSKNDITKLGADQIRRAAESIQEPINAVYASPHLRAKSSAQVFTESRSDKLTTTIDYRLREIDYGADVNNKDSEPISAVAKKQIAGNYNIRFGETGENKREIITRFTSFIIDLLDTHQQNDVVVVFSHGRAISIIEGALREMGVAGVGDAHVHTSNAGIKRMIIGLADRKLIVDKCGEINIKEVERRKEVVSNRFHYFDDIERDVQDGFFGNYIKVAEEGIGNVELSYEILDPITDGFYKSKIKHIQKSIQRPLLDSDEVIVVCVLRNAHKLVDLFIEHYTSLGIKNFVFIDNDSDDDTISSLLRNSSSDENIHIDIWSTTNRFDSFRSCGWRQRMFAYYGINRWYLDLDIDEFFVYPGMESLGIDSILSYARDNHLTAVGSVILDMYSDKPVLDADYKGSNIISLYKYIDKDSYVRDTNIDYGYRIYGGPRRRKFGISPWLQKLPLIYVEQNTININPHFWYPFSINSKRAFVSALLHYKFLPGDYEQYIEYAKTGVHWNNSKEYKTYVDILGNDSKFTFYDHMVSVEYKNSNTLDIINVIDKISS